MGIAEAHTANQVFFWGWTIGCLIAIALIWALVSYRSKHK
jgi:hypothetical protein